MFERLVGTISGIREGIEEAAAVTKQEAARIRKEKRETAKMAKAAAAAERAGEVAAAKKASKEKLGRSKTAERVIKLGAAVISSRDAAAGVLEWGQELRQKGKVRDSGDALAALVGTPAGQTPQQEHSPPEQGFGRGGLPPI